MSSSSASPMPISSSRSSSTVTSALSDAISTPVSRGGGFIGQINAIAGPSRPASTRRITPSPIKKEWSLVAPSTTVAVAGKTSSGEKMEFGKRGEGVERGLSELIIRSDRSPEKRMAGPSLQRMASRATISDITRAGEMGGKGKEESTGKKGWGISLVGGAMNAGVYGAALGVTAYKLWKQSSSTQSTEPVGITASASAPANLSSASSEATPSSSPLSEDSTMSITPTPLPVVSEIAPPPAYRERDQADNPDWTDELDDEDLITPTTSRTPTVRLAGHQHPLLRNTPSRSWGKKRRTRILSNGLPKRSSVSYGEMTPPLALPPSPASEDSDTITPISVEAVAEVVEGQEEILDRLDGMTLRIQRLILEGQAALVRRPDEVDGMGHSRGSRGGSGSWGRRGRGSLRMRVSGEGGKVVRNRRSLPVVGVTVGHQ